MKRGDIVLFDFPFSDGTGSKLRPALVVQTDALNNLIQDTILAAITRTVHATPTQVLIDISTPDGARSGIRFTSVVDCKILLTVDKSFLHRSIGMLPASLLQQVDLGLKHALGLP